MIVFSCLSLSFGIVGISNDKETLQSMVVAKHQKDTNTSFSSGYIVQDGERPNYYHAGLFYETQYFSDYWNYDEAQTNTFFFRYRESKGKRTVKLSDASSTPTSYGVDLLIPLARDPLHMFRVGLLCGSEAPKNTIICEYVYISEALADKLVSPFETLAGESRVNKFERVLLYDESKGNSLDASLFYVSGEKSIQVRVAGVIKQDTLGPYASFVDEDFMMSRWSADIQTAIYFPNLFVLFGSDPVRNAVYFSQMNRAYAGTYWHFFMADELGGTVPGALNERIQNVAASYKGWARITLYAIAIFLGVGLFVLWLCFSFIYLRDRYSWASKKARRIACLHFVFAALIATFIVTLMSTSSYLYTEQMFSLDGLSAVLLVLLGILSVFAIHFAPKILTRLRPLPTDRFEI